MSIERIEVVATEPLAGGRTFGRAGAHVVERGVVHGAVDPAHPANARIVDLARAADADGLVRWRADYRLVRPAAGGPLPKLLVVVPNRGMVGGLPFSRDLQPGVGLFDDRVDAGDGFALERGWAVLWCGWQWDIVPAPGRLGLEAPLARIDGRPITGWTRADFLPLVPTADRELSDTSPIFAIAPLPTVDLDDPDAVLTVRTSTYGPRTVIDRARWRFARDVDGAPQPSADHVWLEGGFVPFHFYEVVYRTAHSVVAGTGLLSMRDTTAAFRARHGVGIAMAYGASQSGRFLRQLLHDGVDIDERGRRVFDAMFIDIAGTRRGEFNHRYAQPSYTQVPGFGHLPPFALDEVLGPVGRVADPPRVFSVNSAFEYWRGDAALLHATVDGRDRTEAPWSRSYLVASTDHLGPVPLRHLQPTENPPNVTPRDAVLRALFVALDDWTAGASEPPPSAVPHAVDGTLVRAGDVLAALPPIPGLGRPEPAQLPGVRDLDLGPDTDRGIGRWPVVAGAARPTWVSAVDPDGNEVAGIRHPLVAAPLATSTGWNPRRHTERLPDLLLEFAGSQVPFAADEAARARTADPRPSIAARYADRAAYEQAARAAAHALVATRVLLVEDLEATVAVALGAYDALVSS